MPAIPDVPAEPPLLPLAAASAPPPSTSGPISPGLDRPLLQATVHKKSNERSVGQVMAGVIATFERIGSINGLVPEAT
jgi:hypothetical protein